MSEDWSKLRDVDPLADGRVRFDLTIPLAEFPRLRSQLARADGEIRARVSFDRERELPAADVEVAGCAALTCQRCLEPLDFVVRSRGRVALVADATEADRAPEDLETMLAPGHRITLRDLVEEELLLALPLVPLHTAEACAGAAGREGPQGPTERERSPRRPGREAAGRRRTEPRPGSTPDGGPEAAAERHRPFERLDELLKRSK